MIFMRTRQQWATGWTVGFRFRAKDFSLFYSVQTESGAYKAFYAMGKATGA
jgi:hypothetical protein